MIKMKDEYRIVTARGRPGYREYANSVRYNGEKLESALSDDLRDLIDEFLLRNRMILVNNPKINSLEVTISGEDLK